MNTIVRLFKDADLRCQHEGLRQTAKDADIDLDKLKQGEHVVFLNAKLTKVKIYSLGGILTYYRAPSGRLNLHMIAEIPKCFGSKGELDWKKAEKIALDKMLARK